MSFDYKLAVKRRSQTETLVFMTNYDTNERRFSGASVLVYSKCRGTCETSFAFSSELFFAKMKTVHTSIQSGMGGSAHMCAVLQVDPPSRGRQKWQRGNRGAAGGGQGRHERRVKGP